jgi:hypothetical protein
MRQQAGWIRGKYLGIESGHSVNNCRDVAGEIGGVRIGRQVTFRDRALEALMPMIWSTLSLRSSGPLMRTSSRSGTGR